MIAFNLWLPTPSYNSLALQGILVCVIGWLLAEKTTAGSGPFGWERGGRVLAGWVLIERAAG